MNLGIFARILLCILALGGFLYSYIDKQNEITQLRLQIPQIEKELLFLKQENSSLQFEVEKFKNPLTLMQLAQRPEFSHLKYPLAKEIITLPKASPLEL